MLPRGIDDLTLGDRGVVGRERRERRGTEVLEVATTTLLAPGSLTLRTGSTAVATPGPPPGPPRPPPDRHRDHRDHRRDRHRTRRDDPPPPPPGPPPNAPAPPPPPPNPPGRPPPRTGARTAAAALTGGRRDRTAAGRRRDRLARRAPQDRRRCSLGPGATAAARLPAPARGGAGRRHGAAAARRRQPFGSSGLPASVGGGGCDGARASGGGGGAAAGGATAGAAAPRSGIGFERTTRCRAARAVRRRVGATTARRSTSGVISGRPERTGAGFSSSAFGRRLALARLLARRSARAEVPSSQPVGGRGPRTGCRCWSCGS